MQLEWKQVCFRVYDSGPVRVLLQLRGPLGTDVIKESRAGLSIEWKHLEQAFMGFTEEGTVATNVTETGSRQAGA